MTCEYTGASCTGAGIVRSVGYTSFNMPATISDRANADALTYDSEHTRITQVATGASAGTTVYLNDPASGAMEEQFTAGATMTWRDYIQADGHMVAMRLNTAGSISANYFTLDHLGSIAAVTDASGAVVERDSYDPWGKRRNPTGAPAACGTIASATTRGFTAQEMMDPTCLINLNARVYDPSLGRILSPDSIIPDTYSPQTRNRYTYVDNGPLSLTDPTGNMNWRSPIWRWRPEAEGRGFSLFRESLRRGQSRHMRSMSANRADFAEDF